MILQSFSSGNSTLPPIPDYTDDLQWVTAYLVQHMLSASSWVYAWILWIAIAIVFFSFSFMRWAGLRRGYLGAVWSKWALRRRTWRKKHALAVAQKAGQPHRQPMSLPSNAQMLTVCGLFISVFALAFIGPDYFAPGSQLWNIQDYPAGAVHKRSLYDLSNYTYLQPQFTISKAWWTSGGRTGLIAFALFPLTVLFALKAAPFAIFSSPYFVQLCFDKLAFLHRWCGFLVWVLTTLHTIFWSVQLASDHRPSTGQMGYTYAWQYDKFIYAWVAYGCFTALLLGAIPYMRHHHYEAFYFLHILFVPLTLIMSALHHPPLGWWCWSALALWFGERCYRFTWWLNTNGFFGGMPSVVPPNKLNTRISYNTQVKPDTLPMHSLGQANAVGKLPSLPRIDPTLTAPVRDVVNMVDTSYVPPPGFIHAELLPGRTVRVRLVTPGFVSWAPGQHFLINIPSVSAFTSHPFTNASVCDSEALSNGGRELVFFIRAKKGWTKDLWDTVAALSARGMKHPKGEQLPAQCPAPPRGVLMRGYVDGPFGSAARAHWGDHSSVLLIAGGSGVSFALSILVYICMCMAGRDGRELGGRPGGYGKRNFRTTRVRFVWIIREFGHVHWCAKYLRRCMAMVSPTELQIDIFVTHAKPVPKSGLAAPINPLAAVSQDPLMPPHPHFVQDDPRRSVFEKTHSPASSLGSLESEEDEDELVDLTYYTTDIVEEDKGELGHDEHILDLTNFEGDDDTALPGEAALNIAVKQEGRMRRSFFRRTSMFNMPPVVGADHRASSASYRNWAGRSSVRLINERPASMAMMSLGPLAEGSTSKVHLPSPLSSSVATPTSAAPLLSTKPGDIFTFPPSYASRSPSPPQTNPRISVSSSRPESPRPASTISQWSEAHSLAALVSEAAAQDKIRLELDEEEIIDISVVAECTRAGRPTFSRILADEVEQSKGPVIVGCCGPTSLNAVVRKNIAAQIDPSRLRNGDERGHIALVAEDFGY